MRKHDHRRLRDFVIALCLCSAVAFVLASCGSSSSPTAPAGGGNLQIKLMDAPTDEICKLVVYIEDLRVKPDGLPQMLLGNQIGEFDLLELQDGPPVLLGDFAVDPGLYQFIEILLDESQSFVVEKIDPDNSDRVDNCLDEPSPLQIPSAKFKVNGGPFEVDDRTEIVIDFDAEKSLSRKTGGGGGADKGWQLKPDVSIAQVDP